MTHQEISEDVDIYLLPPLDTLHATDPDKVFTIGDAHGSAAKILYLLTRHGFINGISPEDYQQFIHFTLKTPDEIFPHDIESFNDLIGRLSFNPAGFIRFSGDLFCERALNDYPLLKLLEAMNNKQLAYEILYSNHDLEFIEAYENYEETKCLSSPRFADNVGCSLKNLNTLLELKLIDKEDIFQIINKAYKPALKLLSYAVNEEENSFTLFSHAGIDLSVVKLLAEKWGIEYKENTLADLAKIIDQINDRFQESVVADKVHELYEKDPQSPLLLAGRGAEISPESDPLIFTVWNRYYTKLNRPVYSKAGFKLYFVHGHDSQESSHENIYNLDNALGKGIHFNKGKYTVLLTDKKNNLEDLEEAEFETSAEEEMDSSAENIQEGLNALKDFDLSDSEAKEMDEPDKLETYLEGQPFKKSPVLKAEKDKSPYSPGLYGNNVKNNHKLVALDEKDNEMDIFSIKVKVNKNIACSTSEGIFLSRLKEIKKKGEELKVKYFEAADKAATLHDNLALYFNDYKANKMSLEAFKANSKQVIEEVRPVLEKHRGWKEFLGNVALFIGMLGAGFIITGLVTLAKTGGKQFLFYKFETESGKKVNMLEDALNNMAPTF